MISICSSQKDYITPIIKLCGIRLTDPLQKDRIADVLFWYLGECLAGRVTEYGNEEQYIDMLAILINFLFIPSSLQMIRVTSPMMTVQIIHMLF